MIQVDEKWAERLGLEQGESLRVVHRGNRTILLERSGGDENSAIPWDRDLVLSADVRAFPLADLLSLLHDAGKSGFLVYSDTDVEKSVYLNRGEVVFASSNQTVDRLGECLLRDGAIQLEELRDAERRFAPGVRFGKVLVERGYLTPRELWNGVKHQVEEIVRSLFSHTVGSVHFWEGAVQPDNVVRLSLPTRRLIAEGLERRDQLLRFVAELELPSVRLCAVPGFAIRDRIGNERLLLETVSEAVTFQHVCREAGLDPLTAARTIQMLSLLGALTVERDAIQNESTMLGDEQVVRDCVLDHVKLLAELSAPLVALEGMDAIGERLGRVVEEAAVRYPELLGGLELGPGGQIDPEELARRALRLPAGRERMVSEALGELVAYLEFELKNSPSIEEPDRFLEAVEELRARIEI